MNKILTFHLRPSLIWRGGLACLSCWVLLAGGWVHRVAGQDFKNMDFEGAGAHTIPGNAVWLSWNLAAAGWQHAAGADTVFVYHSPQQSSLNQCYFLVDGSSSKWTPLAGNFSLALSSGYYAAADSSSTWVPASISQQGTIPSDAHSFRMLALGDFTVSIDATPIHMSSVGGGLFAGDISQFAGQAVTLRVANSSTQLHDPVVVDNLAFSSQAVPEPASLTLLGLGVGIAGVRARLQRERRTPKRQC